MSTKRAILIADRGDGLGLRCMSPGDMLRLERAGFVPGPVARAV